MAPEYDVIIAGGGMVGAAIGYGLAGLKQRVLVLDGADTDFRAAKANFGLIWAHGKGMGNHHYQRMSLQAVKEWPQFAAQLEAETGMCLAYERKGGFHFCLGEREFVARSNLIQKWHAQTPDLAPSTHLLDRSELIKRFPSVSLGRDVSGASFGTLDGHANPLILLAALQKGLILRGATLLNNHSVTSIKALHGGGFEVAAGAFRARGARVVIAAGLGASALGPMVGLDVPISPQRGQILVTERVAPILPIPASGLRQTREGTVMIGVTQEDVGFDLSTTAEGAARMIRKAVRLIPDLANVKLVRQWACLRVMTPDGEPVYASSLTHPGADIALCHSGVTLASFHAGTYAKALAGGGLPTSLRVFHHDRFNVQKTA